MLTGLVMLALVLTGCSGGGTARASGRGDRVVAGSAAAGAPRALTADERACTGVQAVIGHLTARTARWSPTAHPFDPAIATQIRWLAEAMGQAGARADSLHIKSVVHLNALAFSSLSVAMTAKKRLQVTRALAGTRLAYRQLKVACSLS